MAWITSRVVYSLLFFAMSTVLLLVAKPSYMFDEEGHPKPFGIGPGKTPFSLGAALLVIALASFFLFSVLGMMSACSDAARRGKEGARARMFAYATPNVAPTNTYVPPLFTPPQQQSSPQPPPPLASPYAFAPASVAPSPAATAAAASPPVVQYYPAGPEIASSNGPAYVTPSAPEFGRTM